MKISTKVSLLIAGFTFSLILLVAAGWQYSERMVAFSSKHQTISELEITLINLRRNEKDFIDRLSLQYAKQFNANIILFDKKLDALNEEVKLFNLTLPRLNIVHEKIANYQSKFNSLVSIYEKLGLNKQSGLWGQITSVNNKLTQQFPRDPEINHLITLAQLFIAQTTEAHYQKFEIEWKTELFRQNLTLLEKQQELIDRFMAMKHEAGLNPEEGLMKEIRTETHSVEENFDHLRTQLSTQLEAEKERLTFNLAIVLFVVFVALIAFSIGFNRSIQKRLRSLTDVISRIASEKDLTLRSCIIGNDEIADVGRDLNLMLDDYQKLIAEVQSLVHVLNEVADDMHDRSLKVESSLNTQAEEASMAAESVKDMEMRILDISSNTELAAANAEQSFHRANKGNQTVTNTNLAIMNLSGGLDQANLDVQSLVSMFQQIGSVVDVIKNISEQINLLALNAAIEAARAGDQGRGFAVVADEVRSLASRTNLSTDEIASMIEALQLQIDQVVACIIRCKNEGEESVDFVKAASEELDNIMLDMQKIMDMSTYIATSIEQQSSVVKEVSMNVQFIQEITKNNTQTTSENSAVARQIFEQSKHLSSAIADFTSK